MNSRRNQNSILILTTLGVYLGLVLVCATPQIKAQTVKIFARSSAKSVKPGKPAVDVEFTDVPLERFLDHVKLVVRTKSLNLSRPIHLKVSESFDPRDPGDVLFGTLDIHTGTASSAVLLDLVTQFLLAIDESNLFGALVDTKNGQSINGASIEVLHNDAQTAFNITLKTDSPATAQRAVSGFNALFAIAKRARKGTPEVKFYESATTSFDNDQVLIVTHMPRAAIEEFLTDNGR